MGISSYPVDPQCCQKPGLLELPLNKDI
jgi:hypothetical protein